MSKVAVIQMTSSAEVQQNLQTAAKLINEAVKQKAQLIVLPENFGFMGFDDAARMAIAEEYGTGVLQEFLETQARQHDVWIIGGTIPIKTLSPDRVRSASLLFDNQGQCVSRYDKIHLFDVYVADINKNYVESASTEPGERVVISKTPFGKLGLSICYDIRFPELYRQQIQEGAELLAIPAAFTQVTGEVHWEILCRARAIENLAYVFASGQSGTHENGRQTYGHSLIIDPWGKVLAKIETGEGVIVADIDLQAQQEIRKKFPSLSHRGIFS